FVGFLAGFVLSQGLRRARALLGSVLTFMVAQLASIPLGLIAAGFTALLLWIVLGVNHGRRRGTGLDDWTWYSSRGGGWSGGSFGSGGFSGGGGGVWGGGGGRGWGRKKIKREKENWRPGQPGRCGQRQTRSTHPATRRTAGAP